VFRTVTLCIRHSLPSLGPPTFIDVPDNTSASQGNNITLRCSAFGIPEPLITWLHISNSGLERNPSRRDNVYAVRNLLSLTNIDYFQDGGQYICIASNIHGTVNASAYLTLDCK